MEVMTTPAEASYPRYVPKEREYPAARGDRERDRHRDSERRRIDEGGDQEWRGRDREGLGRRRHRSDEEREPTYKDEEPRDKAEKIFKIKIVSNL
mmetsp:Transcript_27044/g.38524  ORF Transcript_27044/g.38524 Transcript_27044/m.38524 type:complete len:95 (+) Transcript_27044:364-648(+)